MERSVKPRGHRIQKLRRQLGWTQDDLAFAMKPPSSARTVHRAETGKRIYPSTLKRIHEALVRAFRAEGLEPPSLDELRADFVEPDLALAPETEGENGHRPAVTRTIEYLAREGLSSRSELHEIIEEVFGRVSDADDPDLEDDGGTNPETGAAPGPTP